MPNFRPGWKRSAHLRPTSSMTPANSWPMRVGASEQLSGTRL